jgi:putrescine transport system ATP-binding protein
VTCKPGDTVWSALRPEKVRISSERPAAEDENCVAGEVTEIGYLGGMSIYKVRVGEGLVIKATLANLRRKLEQPIGSGDQVWLTWSPDALVVLTQ